jgi:hypothetical protein
VSPQSWWRPLSSSCMWWGTGLKRRERIEMTCTPCPGQVPWLDSVAAWRVSGLCDTEAPHHQTMPTALNTLLLAPPGMPLPPAPPPCTDVPAGYTAQSITALLHPLPPLPPPRPPPEQHLVPGEPPQHDVRVHRRSIGRPALGCPVAQAILGGLAPRGGGGLVLQATRGAQNSVICLNSS